jgi:hypothetical protein
LPIYQPPQQYYRTESLNIITEGEEGIWDEWLPSFQISPIGWNCMEKRRLSRIICWM